MYWLQPGPRSGLSTNLLTHQILRCKWHTGARPYDSVQQCFLGRRRLFKERFGCYSYEWSLPQTVYSVILVLGPHSVL